MSSNFKPSRVMFIAGVVVALLAAGAAAWAWSARMPRLDPDEQVFEAVDALFTAVRARDDRLLGDCEQRLRNFETAGKLPAPAIGYLNEVIRMARAGKWRPAAEKLYKFMRAQRKT